jgi:hypothetical protein
MVHVGDDAGAGWLAELYVFHSALEQVIYEGQALSEIVMITNYDFRS